MPASAARPCGGDRAWNRSNRRGWHERWAPTTLAFGLGVYPSGSEVAQPIQCACDENDDGVVDADESKLCTDADFDAIVEGEEVLTEEQLFAAKGPSPTVSDIDENGDGQVSRDEWASISDRRFAGATEASGGRMSAEDDAGWWWQGRQQQATSCRRSALSAARPGRPEKSGSPTAPLVIRAASHYVWGRSVAGAAAAFSGVEASRARRR
jgi:hypothetical protein